MVNILSRPRRNRKNSAVRSLVRENSLKVSDLISPLFLLEGKDLRQPINSMPGIYRFSLDNLLKEINEQVNLGIKAICLFVALEEGKKSSSAQEALNPNGIYQVALKSIKDRFPDLVVMTDVALDPYSSDGHDGLVDAASGEILNDATLEVLGKMSVLQAQNGADIIGPSDMMDGRVAHIRSMLDEAGFTNVSIMSYTAKYASSFYGPFRDALDSAPKAGDKKTYQMDYANVREAVRELKLDVAEGADILMVKPGLCFLDVISEMRRHTDLPLAAYNVSGEYSMVKAAANNGWLNYDEVVIEMLTSFKRAHADLILTYFAKDVAKILRN